MADRASVDAGRGTRHVAIALHWLIALAILAMLVMGLAMTHVQLAPVDKFKLYQLHKSVGITILAAGAAAPACGGSPTGRLPCRPTCRPGRRGAAEATHVLLYMAHDRHAAGGLGAGVGLALQPADRALRPRALAASRRS